MDFALDDDQQLIVDTVRRFADRDLRAWSADADRDGAAPERLSNVAGELGFFVASDGTAKPLRCFIRSPSLMNVQVIPACSEGRLFSDMVAIIGSLDFVMGEVDR